jgi:hypothetical protein
LTGFIADRRSLLKGIKNISGKAQARTHEALVEATGVHSMRLAAKMHWAVLSIVAKMLVISHCESCSRQAKLM